MVVQKSKIITVDLSRPELFIPVYLPLLFDKKRTKVIIGSRDSGKSKFACQKMVKKCLESAPGAFKCLMVRKMKEDVRKSIYATIKKIVQEWKLEHLFRFYGGNGSGELLIVCTVNGNVFLPMGTNETGGRTGTAKSVENPTDAIIEEADEITEEEYLKLSLSLRGSENIEEILLLNPPEEEHWIIKRWFPPKEEFELPDGSHTYIKSTVRNATCLHTTYKNNPFISDAEREAFQIIKETNPELYLSQGLGLLKAVKKGGEALPKFEQLEHVTNEDLYNAERRVLLCWDFNRRPFHTVGVWSFHYDQEQKVFFADLVKEFTLEDASVREVQKEINAWLKRREYKPKKVRLIGDHSGTKQIDKDVETFIAKIEREIRRGGFEVINETNPNPPVVSSLEFLNDIFGGYIFLADESNFPGVKIQIRINSSCKFHVADFQKTKTGADGRLLKITKTEVVKDGSESKKVTYQVRGHAVDESRYMATGVFPEEFRLYRKKD